jgi:hypothetical protein
VSESKCTPGPWTVTSWPEKYPEKTEGRQDYWFIEGGKGYCPPDDPSAGFQIAAHLSEGTARQIAAAPELLAALKDIVREIRAYQSPECDDEGAPGAAELKAADAAIAKAEGR